MEIIDTIKVAGLLVYAMIALIVTERAEKSLKSFPDFNHTDITVTIFMSVFWSALLSIFCLLY